MATESPLIGTTIAGKFRIVRLIGKGGMAAVFAAVQTGQSEEVAVKVMKRELVRDRTVLKRFQREAKAASQLDHPNTVRVLDYGVDGEDAYIAMELARGKDLLQVLSEQRPMAQARAAHIVGQVCSALSAAHDRGIIHRDLKPENIMLVPDNAQPFGESVKVLDFGIAKIVAPPRGAKASGGGGGNTSKVATITRSALTRVGTIVGTPAYMSPEQCRGGDLDARSDVYSVGVLMYQLVTGQVPFLGETPLHTAMRHIHAAATPPRELRPDLAESFERIIMKALSKTPDDRQQSAREVENALLAELGAESVRSDSAYGRSWAAGVAATKPLLKGSQADSSAPTGVHLPAAIGATLGRELKYSPSDDDLDDDEDNVRTRIKSDPQKFIRTHLGLPTPNPPVLPENTPTSPDRALRGPPPAADDRVTAMLAMDTPPDSVDTPPQQRASAPDLSAQYDDDDEQPTALKQHEAGAMAPTSASIGMTPTSLTLNPNLITREPLDSASSFPTPVHQLDQLERSDDELPTDRKARMRTMRLAAPDEAHSMNAQRSVEDSEPNLDPSVVVAAAGLAAAAAGVAATEPSLERPAAAKHRPTLRSGGKPKAMATQKLDARPPELAQTLKMGDQLTTALPIGDRPVPGVRSTIERLPGTTGVLLGVGIGVFVSILFAVAVIFFAR